MTGIRPCCPERRAVESRFSFAILVEGAWCWSRWCICCFGVRSRWRRCGCVRVSSRSLRSSYSGTSWPFCAGRSHGRGWSSRIGCSWPRLAGCWAGRAGRRSSFARTRCWVGIASLCGNGGRTPGGGLAGRRSRRSFVSWCCGLRVRTAVGLSADRRRARRCRCARLGDQRRQDPAAGRRATCRRARPAQLARFHPCARRVDHCLRLFHGRDALARPDLCALLSRAWHPPRPPRRLRCEPGWRLGRPAGAAVCLVALRAIDAGAVPDPRPRQQVQPRLRHCLQGRRRRDHPHSVPDAAGERLCRALGRHGPPGLPRLAPDREPGSSSASCASTSTTTTPTDHTEHST